MKRLILLWEAFLGAGSRHFSSPTDLKLNRVLNLLFSLHFLATGYLVVIELFFLVLLLMRDPQLYVTYIIPFGLANILHIVFASTAIWFKNKTGTFRFTYLSTFTYSAYIPVLCAFVGERVNLHIILVMLMPISFILYDYGKWREAFIHFGLMLGGLVASLIIYKISKPLYPVPDDYADFAGYLAWFAGLSLLLIYSIYNWRQVYLTEQLLLRTKHDTQALLNETIPKLEKAEGKYRHLVDDSSDMIFQLSSDATILSMNLTSRKLLGFIPDEMIGHSLFEFIPDGLEGDPELNRNIAREHLRLFAEGKTETSFRATVRKKHMYEPLEVQITLQKTVFHNDAEILGKVSRLEEDVAQKFLEKEKGRYVISNNVTHAEILSQTLSERLARYFPRSELNTIRICFREILINAIEHGNLGITFDQKTQEIDKGDYMEFLLRRQKDPKYASRKIYVDYLINDRSLIFRVTDDGDGFDHKAFLKRADADPYLAMMEHGRGIIMTRNVFDTVVYNDQGNQVILTKKIPLRE